MERKELLTSNVKSLEEYKSIYTGFDHLRTSIIKELKDLVDIFKY